MPSLTKFDAVEAKGKAFIVGAMYVFLWMVAGITLWGIGEFAWKMFGG